MYARSSTRPSFDRGAPACCLLRVARRLTGRGGKARPGAAILEIRKIDPRSDGGCPRGWLRRSWSRSGMTVVGHAQPSVGAVDVVLDGEPGIFGMGRKVDRT